MVQETLGGIHLPAPFTENIVRQIANIKPAAPMSSRPLNPNGALRGNSHFYFSNNGCLLSIPHPLSATLQFERPIGNDR